jgi:hypothetical protein
MAQICRSQQGCLVSRASTCQCHLLHLIRAGLHVRVTLVSHIYRRWDCQIMSERSCQSYVNQCQNYERPCQSHTCQSHIIRAVIVRDYIRAYFHSQDCQGLFQSHTGQSHINQTRIVRPYQIPLTLCLHAFRFKQ